MLNKICAGLFVILISMIMWAPLKAATLLPNGEQSFTDANGNPLAGGSVYFYIPGTTNAKDTYQDPNAVNLNSNPVQLDASGRAIIYGIGSYRQIVKDVAGNTIWDQLTADPSSTNLQWGGNAGGSANFVTLANVNFSATNGQLLFWRVSYTNTGGANLTVNGAYTFTIYKDTNGGPAGLSGGEMVAGNIVEVLYDSTLNGFHLLTVAQ